MTPDQQTRFDTARSMLTRAVRYDLAHGRAAGASPPTTGEVAEGVERYALRHELEALGAMLVALGLVADTVLGEAWARGMEAAAQHAVEDVRARFATSEAVVTGGTGG